MDYEINNIEFLKFYKAIAKNGIWMTNKIYKKFSLQIKINFNEKKYNRSNFGNSLSKK